jgi:type I restriction enzyme S subunit
MEEWKKIKACNYCYNVTDGTHDSPKQKESGRYLITSKHIKNNRIDFESAYKISEDDYNKIISRSKVDQWDIIISMIGAYCGFCCIESSNCTEYAIKNVGLLKVRDELKSRWLYYYLTSPKGKQQLSILRSGSSQPYISLGALRDLEIPVPRERVMNGIVSFLKSLDDKIELNRRINDNLLVMAA